MGCGSSQEDCPTDPRDDWRPSTPTNGGQTKRQKPKKQRASSSRTRTGAKNDNDVETCISDSKSELDLTSLSSANPLAGFAVDNAGASRSSATATQRSQKQKAKKQNKINRSSSRSSCVAVDGSSAAAADDAHRRSSSVVSAQLTSPHLVPFHSHRAFRQQPQPQEPQANIGRRPRASSSCNPAGPLNIVIDAAENANGNGDGSTSSSSGGERAAAHDGHVRDERGLRLASTDVFLADINGAVTYQRPASSLMMLWSSGTPLAFSVDASDDGIFPRRGSSSAGGSSVCRRESAGGRVRATSSTRPNRDSSGSGGGGRNLSLVVEPQQLTNSPRLRCDSRSFLSSPSGALVSSRNPSLSMESAPRPGIPRPQPQVLLPTTRWQQRNLSLDAVSSPASSVRNASPSSPESSSRSSSLNRFDALPARRDTTTAAWHGSPPPGSSSSRSNSGSVGATANRGQREVSGAGRRDLSPKVLVPLVSFADRLRLAGIEV